MEVDVDILALGTYDISRAVTLNKQGGSVTALLVCQRGVEFLTADISACLAEC